MAPSCFALSTPLQLLCRPDNRKHCDGCTAIYQAWNVGVVWRLREWNMTMWGVGIIEPFWGRGCLTGSAIVRTFERWLVYWPLRYLYPFGRNSPSNVFDAQINRGELLWGKIWGGRGWRLTDVIGPKPNFTTLQLSVVCRRNLVDIFCRLSTMYERDRQTNIPRNGTIDRNRQ